MSGDKTWKAPSVTITEITNFPAAVAGVATAVPVFIGHTASAANGLLKPTQIGSLVEYERIFGGAMLGFNLFESVALFYLNGGGTCFVVSVGDFTAGVDAAKLSAGLAAAGKQAGIAMIAIPDAVLLKPDAGSTGPGQIPTSAQFQSLVRAMLEQCGTLQDRIALFDLYGTEAITGSKPPADQTGIDACAANFQKAVGDDFLSYGAAYFPFLEVATGVAGHFRLVPPSGAMAGIFAANDATRGVWSAPANVVVSGIHDVSLALTEAQQVPLNAPINGKSVNAIRNFVNRGPVVWGARTLDGNSNDYRYIQVRRTLIYIEQSIKTALAPFVFAPNDGQTWVAVTAMVSAFLQNLWAQGGLMGDKASDAFTVRCGLGSTMTGQDILDGYMIVAVTLQMVHPAEFIELTFKQQMQGV